MTDAQFKKLEDDRRKREEELLILLLLLFGGAVGPELVGGAEAGTGTPGMPQRATGADLSALQRDLLTQGVSEIAESMADSHLDAFAIYQPTGSGGPPRDTLIRQYSPSALEMVNAMLETLARAGASVETLAEALVKAKYTRSNATGIEIGVERQIVSASNAGLFGGAFAKYGTGGGVTGLRHHSVIDDVTSAQCKERDGLQLPTSDPYWLVNWPSLHARCRSVIVPLVGPFKASTWRPVTPPDVGFGRAPASVLPLLNRRTV